MKKYRFCLIYLISFVCIFFKTTIAQELIRINPPVWSIGDWWVVECQVYDLGELFSGPTEPGWRPKQAWRFQVEGIDKIIDQPYFVVSVKPINNNLCPYWFRFWFRVSDRYVGRYELYHPNNLVTKTRSIGPPVVTKDFSSNDAAPFFSSIFPTLPITVPLFNIHNESISFRSKGGKFDTFQDIEAVDRFKMVKKADSNLLRKRETSLMNENKLIKISTKSNLSEQQYWNSELPWCVYGERLDETIISRRYWLIETGNN